MSQCESVSGGVVASPVLPNFWSCILVCRVSFPVEKFGSLHIISNRNVFSKSQN